MANTEPKKAAGQADKTTNAPKHHHETGFGRLNLKAENHVVASGRHPASIADFRVAKNRAEDTMWAFIVLDVHDADGVVMGQVEERFVTIAAKEGSAHLGRIREGLKRLALYGRACGVDLDGVDPEEIAGVLVGRRVTAVISRYGQGVQAENRIVSVLKPD